MFDEILARFDPFYQGDLYGSQSFIDLCKAKLAQRIALVGRCSSITDGFSREIRCEARVRGQRWELEVAAYLKGSPKVHPRKVVPPKVALPERCSHRKLRMRKRLIQKLSPGCDVVSRKLRTR